MVALSQAPLPTGRAASPVQVERDADDLQVTDDLAIRFVFDLGDEAVHRLGDVREVAPKPVAVES
jgi:hypothetical protein